MPVNVVIHYAAVHDHTGEGSEDAAIAVVVDL